MKIFTTPVLSVLGLAPLLAVLGGPGVPNQFRQVEVTNVPLPVDVNTLPAVSIQGTPSVSISGTPTVGLAPGGVVGMPSHVGVNPQSLVTLTTCASGLCQVLPNGNVQPSAYTIPSGKWLVITDLSAMAFIQNHNTTATFNVFAGPNRYYFSSVRSNEDGMAILSDHITSGLVLQVVPTVSVETYLAPQGQLMIFSLRGYVTPIV